MRECYVCGEKLFSPFLKSREETHSKRITCETGIYLDICLASGFADLLC